MARLDDKMDNAEYVQSLGKLVSNLHSLEFVLRAFLLKHHEGHEPSVDIAKLAVGDKVPSNSFTSYASLGTLLQEYNKVVESRCPSHRLDSAVVDLRDMIAHGRVAAISPTSTFRLLKFGKERDNLVPVEQVAELNHAWLSSRINFVKSQIDNVIAASKSFKQNIVE